MAQETGSIYERLGGLELPVDAALIDQQALAPLDPGRDLLLEFFKAAINAELGAVWAKVTAGGGPLYGTLPVADALPLEPTEQQLQQRKTAFPVLAIHRNGTAVFEQRTLEITSQKQPWTLHYILGPLDAIDQRKLLDMPQAVAKVVALVVRRRKHPAFNDGALQLFSSDPDDPFRAPHFSSIRVVDVEGPGQAAFGGKDSSVLYWAVEIHLETTELSSYIEGAEADLEAGDFTVGVGGEEILPAMIIASTDDEA